MPSRSFRIRITAETSVGSMNQATRRAFQGTPFFKPTNSPRALTRTSKPFETSNSTCAPDLKVTSRTFCQRAFCDTHLWYRTCSTVSTPSHLRNRIATEEYGTPPPMWSLASIRQCSWPGVHCAILFITKHPASWPFMDWFCWLIGHRFPFALRPVSVSAYEPPSDAQSPGLLRVCGHLQSTKNIGE